jgi:hypothetical protein
MTTEEIVAGLAIIDAESDLNSKALLLAGMVSELFRERGFEPVIVGGSAIEFYTDGAYMSGDTDICWAGLWPPTISQREEIMRQIPGITCRGAGKSWRIGNLWIDLLGEVNYVANKDLQRLFTPLGEVVLIPAEDALVGRVYAARKWTSYNDEDDACGKRLMTSILQGSVHFDWDEAYRVAASSKYNCVRELNEVRAEVQEVLESQTNGDTIPP